MNQTKYISPTFVLLKKNRKGKTRKISISDRIQVSFEKVFIDFTLV